MLGLYLRRDLFASRDLAVKADIHGIPLRTQAVTLDDERTDLTLERGALLAQPAGELLPLLEHRLALAAELRLLPVVLRLERIELPAQRRHVAARRAAALDCPLKFADLGILRLRVLLERSDARGRLREAFPGLGALLFPLAGMPVLRLDLFLNLPRRLLLFRTGRVALLHEHLQAIPIRCDFRFQLLDRLRVMGGRVGIRVRNPRKPDFEFRRTQPGGIEIGVDGFVVRVKRIHLRLQILERLAHLGFARFDAAFDLLPHLLLRGLHVVRRLHLPLVRGGEKFLRLRPRLLLAREFLRGFLLRLLHGFDPAVQLIHRAVGLLLAPRPGRGRLGGLRDIFKFRDLRLQPFDFAMFRIEFLAHLLAFLVRTTGEIRANGDGRCPFRDLIHRILQILAQAPGLRDGPLVCLGQRLALPLQLHDLALVVAPHHRDAPLHVGREIGEVQVHLGNCRHVRDGCGRRGVPQYPHRLRRGSWRITPGCSGQLFRRKLWRPLHRLVRTGAGEP